jgi:hypothetical protein
MTERGVVKDRLNQLMYMEEDKILEGFQPGSAERKRQILE